MFLLEFNFWISFVKRSSVTWLYNSIVIFIEAWPMISCNVLGSTPASAIREHEVCLRRCGCVKYRTKKFYFFLPKTIWRSHQVVPAPLLSFDKSFSSCSSYLCSEKISSKFHLISISFWPWTRITLIISRSFSVSNFWIPKKSFIFILSESSFCSRSFLEFHLFWSQLSDLFLQFCSIDLFIFALPFGRYFLSFFQHWQYYTLNSLLLASKK